MIDINSMDRGQVYTLYEAFKNVEERLSQKQEKSELDNLKLNQARTQLFVIEQWIKSKIATDIHWTSEDILSRFGHRATLIFEFHPGSESYKIFGKEIVGNLEFNEEELLELLMNIHNKIQRQVGKIRFKLIPDLTIHEISTADIFQLGGTR